METLPFPAIVGQEDLKTALLLNAVNTSIGGVLIRGDRGTGKSSTVRGLKRILPEIRVVEDCAFNSHPEDPHLQCPNCRNRDALDETRIETPVVELPLGATEDRVVGSLDVERALNEGVNALEPGLLARANRGILYIDEVNLLDNHLIDILLDAAASGVNRVEREGVSVEHPSEFILVGTMNPDEGELRPQLLDRFGLQVDARTPHDPEQRTTIIEIAEQFDREPDAVIEQYRKEEERLRAEIVSARERYDEVGLADDLRRRIAEICLDAGIEGNRGDITTAMCARANAALEGRTDVQESDVHVSIRLALPHRLPSELLEEEVDLERLLDDHLGNDSAPDDSTSQGAGEQPDDPTTDPPDQRRRGGSEQRSEPTDSGDGATMQRLRDFFLSPGGGDEENPDADREGDADDDAGTGRNPDASGAGYLDPIGEGAASEDAPDHQVYGSDVELPRTDVLEERRFPRIETDEARGDGSGRYVTSRQATELDRLNEVAFDASLRSAAQRGSPDIQTQDLRVKVRDAETPALVVVLIDSSASMRAHGNISTAKNLVAPLFRNVCRQQDFVAVISVHDETADVVVPPTDNPRLAIQGIDELPTGNKTPLAHGLATSLQLVRREREADPDIAAILVVMTDGRPTMAIDDDPVEEVRRLSRRLHAEGVSMAILDMDRGTSGTEICRDVAVEADGEYVPLFDFPAPARRRIVDRAVRSLRSQF